MARGSIYFSASSMIIDSVAVDASGGLHVAPFAYARVEGRIERCTANVGGGMIIWMAAADISGLVKSCVAAFFGGGVRLHMGSTLTLTGRIERCIAMLDSGGMKLSIGSSATVAGGTIVDCAATTSAGGVLVDQTSRLTLDYDGAIVGNVASGGPAGGVSIDSQSELVVLHGRIVNNSALSGGGFWVTNGRVVVSGSLAIVQGNVVSGSGGGGAASMTSDVILEGAVDISRNVAGERGGGLFLEGTQANLIASSSTCSWVQASFNFEVSEATLDEVRMGLMDDTASHYDARGVPTLIDIAATRVAGTEYFCLRRDRSHVFYGWSGDSTGWSGGFVDFGVVSVGTKTRLTLERGSHVVAATVNLTSAPGGVSPTIRENWATSLGGGVALVNGAFGTLFDIDIVRNSNGGRGAGIALDVLANFHLYGSRLQENQAATHGGGLSVSFGSSAMIVGSEATGNTCVEDGGFASFVVAASIVIDSTVINGNRAGRGGGMSIEMSVGAMLIYNSVFAANHVEGPDAEGGALRVSQADTIVKATDFRQNVAHNGNGGALVVDATNIGIEIGPEVDCLAILDLIIDFTATTEHCSALYYPPNDPDYLSCDGWRLGCDFFKSLHVANCTGEPSSCAITVNTQCDQVVPAILLVACATQRSSAARRRWQLRSRVRVPSQSNPSASIQAVPSHCARWTRSCAPLTAEACALLSAISAVGTLP